MRRATASMGGGRRAIALLAALSLWLQIVVPAVGTTAYVLAHDHHHAAAQHHADEAPDAPAPQHDHPRLCCIIGGSQLGTGFAPPPSAWLNPATAVARDVAVTYYGCRACAEARRSVLPVGARAPPRFA